MLPVCEGQPCVMTEGTWKEAQIYFHLEFCDEPKGCIAYNEAVATNCNDCVMGLATVMDMNQVRSL